jgi:hypothetical protein
MYLRKVFISSDFVTYCPASHNKEQKMGHATIFRRAAPEGYKEMSSLFSDQ